MHGRRALVRHRRGGRGAPRRRGARNRIPEDILKNVELNKAIAALPKNYNFEIHKTIWKVQQANAKSVALQFPEGLLLYACTISDIIEHFCGVECLIMGDVTYGACCVDDFTARALGCDFLVHYGHSCLVPVTSTAIKVLYIFVSIDIDIDHVAASVRANFSCDDDLVIMGTIQFVASLHKVKELLENGQNSLSDPEIKHKPFSKLEIPQCRPLSRGEVLGCTSPVLPSNFKTLLFVADGRFHLESAMIHNPSVKAFLYNPYTKCLTEEKYGIDKMKRIRSHAITTAKKAKKFGIVLSTLGRQGNVKILERLQKIIEEQGKHYVVVLLSEIFPSKLQMFPNVDAWIQIACPRLSIDWGYAFKTPLLNPYEAEVALGATEWRERYPMDFYAQSGGHWTNRYREDVVSTK